MSEIDTSRRQLPSRLETAQKWLRVRSNVVQLAYLVRDFTGSIVLILGAVVVGLFALVFSAILGKIALIIFFFAMRYL